MGVVNSDLCESGLPVVVRVVVVVEELVVRVPWVDWRLSWRLGVPGAVILESVVAVDFVSLRLVFEGEVCEGEVIAGYSFGGGFVLDFGDPLYVERLVGCVGVVFPRAGVSCADCRLGFVGVCGG